MAFTAVVTGNVTASNDINQIINALNGTANNVVVLQNTAANAPIITARLTATPVADTVTLRTIVSGNTGTPAGFYVRPDGYGGVTFGSATAQTAHVYGTTTGVTLTESLSIGANLTVVGIGSLAGGTITWNGSGLFTTLPNFPFPTNTQLGTSVTQAVAASGSGGQPNAAGVLNTAVNGYAQIAGAQHASMRWNMYDNGTTAIYMATNTASYLYVVDATRPQFSTYVSGTAGTALGASRNMSLAMLDSNGGGAAGYRIWVGTTDPAGTGIVQDGDIWVQG